MVSEPVRKITIGIELTVITAQINDDWDELTATREHFAVLADGLMKRGPGNRAVALTWSVDRVPREEREHGHEG